MNFNDENSDNTNKENHPFSLPEGYFGSFSKKMMLKIELAEELKEFSVLASIDKKLPFITPGNYFAHTEVRSELAAYPKLAAVKPNGGFITPELYFNAAAKAIQTKIEVTEELKTYPVLYAIDKQNAFVAPQNYFEGLSYTVREKLFAGQNETGFTKVIHLVFSKKTVYAMAAMLVISLGLYFYNSGDETVNGNCNTLACLEKNEIFKANQLMNLDEEALIEMVNTEKLSKNLKENLKETNTETDKQTKEDYALENIDVNDIVDEI